MVCLSEPLRTWCRHPQKLEFNGDSNKLFSLQGPQFPHLSYQANTPNHCELLRPSASEFRSPRPETEVSICTVSCFYHEKFCSSLRLKNTDQGKSWNHTNQSHPWLSWHPHTWSIQRKKKSGTPNEKQPLPTGKNHVRQGSSPGLFSKAKQNQRSIKALHCNSRKASCMRTWIPL